jgi:hypothetical protein
LSISLRAAIAVGNRIGGLHTIMPPLPAVSWRKKEKISGQT